MGALSQFGGTGEFGWACAAWVRSRCVHDIRNRLDIPGDVVRGLLMTMGADFLGVDVL
jgi:hypothetical protein